MFNPEMMAMAQDMMSKMTPEQMAQMQRQAQNLPPDMMQQAMQQMQNMTPEQIQQMRAATQNMTGEQLAAQANAGMGQASAQQQYGLTASEQLKAEGNRLHGTKQYGEAADKYRRAISNLAGQTSLAARQLRTSCQSNLASCYLQLQRWQECVDQCGEVLAVEASNRKALYRRGQALCALGRYDAAVDDLRQAVRLSPESEKDLIREKLAEAKQKQRQAQQGVVIEEVTEPAAADEQPPEPTQQPAAEAVAPAAEAAAEQREGLAESDDDMPALEETTAGTAGPSAAPAAPAMPAFPPGGFAMPGAMPPGMDAQRMQQAQEMFKSNPEMARQAASAMASMSDDQLAAMLAQSGMPGVTPDMAKQAAAMMRSMPPDQLAAMAQAQAAAGFPAAPGMPPMPAAPAAPAPSAGTAAVPAGSAGAAVPAAAAAGGSPDQMAAAAEAMKQNPEMLKQAASMMENMSEEQLRSMAAMMPGGAAMDPAQLKMAAAMMKNMSPEDMERMTRMAASMGAVPGAAPATAGGAAAAPASGSGAAPGAAAPGMGPMGMPAGFDPSNMPPEMMADMRKRMQDPEMLRTMKNMLKSMDPESLAAAMQQSGMNVTPEQARSIADKLDSVSDKHLELMAKLMAWINATIDFYRRAKAWVLSQGALALAVLILVVALLLRWLDWL